MENAFEPHQDQRLAAFNLCVKPVIKLDEELQKVCLKVHFSDMPLVKPETKTRKIVLPCGLDK